MIKPRKPKKCKVCSVEFVPARQFQKTCSGKCALEFAKSERVRKAEAEKRKKLKARKLEAQPRSYWIKEAQKAVNAYVRARDNNLPCVSCGATQSAQWDAGHYRTTAAAPQLRFDVRQIHKQCIVCNRHKSGNLISYRLELINRVGHQVVDEIESNNQRHKWTIEECKEIKAEYQAKLKQLTA